MQVPAQVKILVEGDAIQNASLTSCMAKTCGRRSKYVRIFVSPQHATSVFLCATHGFEEAEEKQDILVEFTRRPLMDKNAPRQRVLRLFQPRLAEVELHSECFCTLSLSARNMELRV